MCCKGNMWIGIVASYLLIWYVIKIIGEKVVLVNAWVDALVILILMGIIMWSCPCCKGEAPKLEKKKK